MTFPQPSSLRRRFALTVQFEDHSKLRFPWPVILPSTSVCVFRSAETVNITFIYNFCWTKYSHSDENEYFTRARNTEHGKRSFEWTVKGMSCLPERLMLVGTELDCSTPPRKCPWAWDNILNNFRKGMTMIWDSKKASHKETNLYNLKPLTKSHVKST